MTREECEQRILEKLEEAISIANEYCDGKCEYLTVSFFNEDYGHSISFHNNHFEAESIKPIDFSGFYDDVSDDECEVKK